MKKTSLITIMIWIFITYTLASDTQKNASNKPLPTLKTVANTPKIAPIELQTALKTMMKVPALNINQLENNLYVELLGITYDVEDYKNIYKAYIMASYYNGIKHAELLKDPQQLNALTEPLSLEWAMPAIHFNNLEQVGFDPTVIFPCGNYLSQNCIAETLNNQKIIAEAFQKNQELLARYQSLLAKNNHYDFVANLYNYEYMPLPGYGITTLFFPLQFSQAIIDFKNGQSEQAITRLESFLNYKKQTTSIQYNSELIQVMTTLFIQQQFDQTLNALLDQGYFSDYLNDPRIIELFNVTNLLQQKIMHAIFFEAKMSLLSPTRGTALLPTCEHNIALSHEDELIALNWFELAGISYLKYTLQAKDPTFANEEAFNKQEAHFMSADDLILSGQEQAHNLFTRYKNYFIMKNYRLSDLLQYFNQKYVITHLNQDYPVFKTYEALIAQDQVSNQAQWDELLAIPTFFLDIKSYEHDIQAIEEQAIYSKLLQLKFMIIKDNIIDEKIPALLASKPLDTRHSVEDRIIQWDASKRTLSLPLSKTPKILPANIRTATEKNQAITNWEVTIPAQSQISQFDI